MFLPDGKDPTGAAPSAIASYFFGLIKALSSIATRYEMTAHNFFAELHLVCGLFSLTSPNASAGASSLTELH
jgi:hypothetical protein